MTEGEAKAKWCCGPKLVTDALLAQLRINKQIPEPNPPSSNGLCIGSACMAWRWKYRAAEQGEKASTEVLSTFGEPVVRTPHGFCGLAGKP